MDIPKLVAKMRFHYHLNLLDINNVLNQLGLRDDEKAEKIAKHHTMIAVGDCLPRLGYNIHLNSNKDEES